MGCLFFCDVDENGKIVESLVGERVIPGKQYDHFFYLAKDTETVLQEVGLYRVINNQLVLES